MKEDLEKCESCGLATEDSQHEYERDCIREMRIAMLKQKQSAERIGMDISIHFLRALEELSIRPDVGFRYTTMIDGQQMQLPPQQVSGVFASLLKVYREQSDFDDEDAQRGVATRWAWLCGKLGAIINTWMVRYYVSEEDKLEADTLLEDIATDTVQSLEDVQEELGKEQGLCLMLEGVIRAVYDIHKDDLAQPLGEEIRSIIEDLESRHHHQTVQPDLGDS